MNFKEARQKRSLNQFSTSPVLLFVTSKRCIGRDENSLIDTKVRIVFNADYEMHDVGQLGVTEECS